MKKSLILCSVLFGFVATGLLAEDATVSLPALANPTPPPSASTTGSGTTGSGKKHDGKSHKGHKGHHKHSTDSTTPTPSKP